MKRSTTVVIHLAALLAVSGCAVMKIDVDVYKGPMANNKDVQTEQLAALAMGAKPLLIELRDKLDGIAVQRSGYPKLLNEEQNFKSKVNVTCTPPVLDYKRDFIRTPPRDLQKDPAHYADHAIWLTCQQSIRVNAILSLYQDQNPAELTDLIASARGALHRYEAAWAIFTDQHDKDKANFKALFDERTGPQPLIDAYHKFLVPNRSQGSRDQRQIFNSKNASALSTGSEEDEFANKQFMSLAGSLSIPSGTGKNKPPVESDAAKLFPDDHAKQVEFTKQVQTVAQSFLDARQACADLFELVLKIDERANTANIGEESRKLISAKCADIVNMTIERTFLYQTLHNDKGPGVGELRKALESRLGGQFFQKAVPTQPPENDEAEKMEATKEAMTRALHDLLIDQPGQVARYVLDIHLGLTSAHIQISGIPDEVSRYGLARIEPPPLVGQSVDRKGAQALLKADDLRGLVTQTFADSGGLEGGRLDTGIETAINRYLEAAQSYDENSRSQDSKDKFESSRRDLVRQLIHFSEKLVFIAENQLLMNDQIPGISEKDKMDYAALLQTIGNSILVTANELYERDQFENDRDSETAKQRMISALKSIQGGLASEQLLALTHEYQSNPRAVMDPTIVKALDDLTGSGDYTAAKQKADSESTAAKSLSDALTKLNVQALVYQELLALDWRDIIANDLIPTDSFAIWFGDIIRLMGGGAHADVRNISPDDFLKGISDLLAKQQPPAAKDDLAAQQKALLGLHAATTPVPVEQAAAAVKASIIDQVTAAANDEKAKAKVVSDLESAKKNYDNEQTAVREALDLIGQKIDQIATADAAPAQKSGAGDNNRNASSAEESAGALRSRVAACLVAIPSTDPNAPKASMAIKVLSRISIPKPLVVSATAGDTTPRDVMDDLLATLRTEHVAAVREQGEDSTTAQKLAAAIHVAEIYRSDMVYIRPPAAFLRTSNVATVLQQGGSGAAWQNLLARQGIRGVPLVGEPLTNSELKNKEMVQQLDKQFWQNINTVRVAGSGITNYVVTKDDIGNWYVKQYSADPGPIVEAAKNMALYNAGNAIGGASAAHRALQLSQDPNAPLSSPTDPRITPFQTDYQKSTTSFAADLAGDKGAGKPSAQASIDTSLISAWSNDSTLADSDLQKRLPDVQKAAEKPAPDIAGDAKLITSPSSSTSSKSSAATKAFDTQLPEKLITVLQKLKDYQDRILSGIDNLHFDSAKKIQDDQAALASAEAVAKASLADALANTSDSSKQTKALTDAQDVDKKQAALDADTAIAVKQAAAAKADVVTAFGNVLNPLLQKRLSTVTAYDTALNVLQTSITPPTKSNASASSQ